MDLQSFAAAAAASMACSSSYSPPPSSSAAMAALPRAETKPSCEPQLAPVSPSPSPSPAPPAKAQGAKRSRKAQQKRIVCVPVAGGSSRPSGGEGVPSDLWAWRKYGQKPIKGSPYPRGYYRCSSSKGCSARKQVERSRTDPSMLVITYTSDHNHPWPTHRNALAGSTRQQQQQQQTIPPQNQQQPTFNSSNGATAGATANDNDSNKSSSSNSSGNGNGGHVQDNNSKNNALVQQNNNNNHSSNRPPGPEKNNNPHEHCDVALAGATVAVVIDQKPQQQSQSQPQPQQHKHNCNGNANDDSCYCGVSNNNIIGTMTCGAASTMEISVEDSQNQQQADDFFADLGELPDSLYVFEDDSSGRSDEDAVVLDPFNLFTWSSSSSSSSSSFSATAPLHAKSAMF